MTTETLTLADFLLARIAEDEREALNASDRAPGGPYRRNWEILWTGTVDPGAGADFSTNDRDMAMHIARWNPARVLAECESKRQILAQHVQMSVGQPVMADEEGADQQCVSCGYAEQWEMREYGPTFPCPTLRALALPYADHPDYREEWRP